MESDFITTLLTQLVGSQFGPYVLALLSVLGGLLTIASAIVPFTKTPKDDEVVGKIKAFLGRFSIFEPKAK